LRRLTAAVVLGLGCASPGMPPGGPPDVAAPQLIATIPDSGTLGVSPKEVIFRFDEVVAERPPSATTLDDLFLISPRDGTPRASWHRDAISVRPRSGWRPNTPYTVIMLRGIADIRGNVRNTGASTFFSTGKTIPRTRLTGRVFDWIAGTPAGGALVESFVKPDSLHPYMALADSTGAFAIEHLPPARYTVRAYLDRNKNLGIDPGEPWDSVSVNVADSATATLLMFAHDTVAPRIRDVSLVDSVSVRVLFDKPVNPAQTLTAANFAVIGPDSVSIPIVSAGAPPKDSVARPVNPPPGAPRPAAPAIPPRGDTATAAKPVMPRPSPITEIAVKLQRPLAPRRTYRIRAIGIRGLLGHTGDSERTLTTPAPPPAPAPKPSVTPPPPSVKK
jgi:Big-like domain-containing protein